MKKNIGKTDKTIRLIVGAVIILVGIFMKSWWGLLGLLPITTALIGWCALYPVLGINTCRIETKKPQAEDQKQAHP